MEREINQGERLYVGQTDAYEYGVKEHFDRYNFAKKFLKKNFIVLDAACGSGYGTEILSDSICKIFGLEFNNHAIKWAISHHKRENMEFIETDLNEKINFPDDFFDAVVSFETIEHIRNQDLLVSEFNRILKPSGILIISSPDREVINENGMTQNPYHINELNKKEFIDLIGKYFKIESVFGQTKKVVLHFFKRMIKKIAKLDFLGFRRILVKILGLKYFVHKHFTPMAEIPIEKTDTDSQNKYYTLIAVCKNKE